MATTPQFRFRALGTLDLRNTSGEEIGSVLTQRKRLAVFVYLALAKPRGFHQRDRLLGLFWAELEEDRARNALNKAVHHLRVSLGDDVVQRRGDGDVSLDFGSLECDVLEFERAVEEDRLEEALSLYAGDLLPGFYLEDAWEFEQWLDRERTRLRDMAREAAWTLSERAEAAGSIEGAVRWGQRAVELSPGNEIGFRRYLLLLDRIGDRARAMREYEAFVRELAATYEVEPSPETRRLVEMIQAREAVAVPAAGGAEIVAGAAEATTGPAIAPPVATASRETGPASTPAPAAVAGARRAGVRLNRRWALAGAVIIALGIGAVAKFGSGLQRRAPITDSIAIFPFTVHGSTEFEYLTEGLASLLTSGLNVGDLRTVSHRTVLDAVASDVGRLTVERAREIARQLGAGTFVLGDVVEARNRLRISASIYDAATASSVLGGAEVQGDAADLFALVEELATRLLTLRRPGIEAPQAERLLLATRSAEALEAYVEGEREYRVGRYAAAVAAFQRAVAADTGFALAYVRLSQAANWTGSVGISSWAGTLAAQMSGSMPEQERLSALAWDAYIAGRPDTAIALYQRVLERDSLDSTAWFVLAENQYHWLPLVGHPAEASRPAWERVIALDSANAGAAIHLARLAAIRGDRPGFEKWAARVSALRPDQDRTIELELLRAFAFGDAAARDAVAPRLSQASNPEVVKDLLVNAAVASSDLAGVTEHLIPQMIPPELNTTIQPLHFHYAMEILVGRGKVDEAHALLGRVGPYYSLWALKQRAVLLTLPFIPVQQAELRAVRRALGDSSVDPADRAYLQGLASVRLGETQSALAFAASLEALTAAEADTAMARRMARVLRAEVAGAEGNPDEALRLLGPPRLTESVLHVADHQSWTHERWLRAGLLVELGRDDEALQIYDSFPSPLGLDLAFAAPAHERRGEIYLHRGDSERAAWHFTRAAGYWRDADAPLRARAASLMRSVAAGAE